VLQCVFVYAPFMNTWFHTAPAAARDWLLPAGLGAGVFLLVEIEKLVGRWLTPSPEPAARITAPLPRT